jgi:Glycosyltransferase sugar-binding region containing DXD motif
VVVRVVVVVVILLHLRYAKVLIQGDAADDIFPHQKNLYFPSQDLYFPPQQSMSHVTYLKGTKVCPDPSADKSNPSYVPHIIHQTYKTNVLPDNLLRWREECKTLNPCWEFKLWTDEDNLDLVKTYFPELLSLYEGYDIKIKRIDAARYMMLHKYGGVYMDMDITCLRSFNESTFGQPNTFYAAQQHAPEAIPPNQEQRVANAFMASPPRHPLLTKILERLPRVSNLHVVCATGPCLLTGMIDENVHNDTIQEFRLEEMFSTSFYDADGKELCAANRTACMARYPGYLVSFWTNSWSAKGFDDVVPPPTTPLVTVTP